MRHLKALTLAMAAVASGDLAAAGVTTATPSANIQQQNNLKSASGCVDERISRQSELCAQWSAADAAHEASIATWAAVVLSFFGTLFIVLTFAETRRTARRQLRAYVVTDVSALFIGEGGHIEAEVLIMNKGQTPAFKTRWAGNIVVEAEATLEESLRQPNTAKNPLGRAVMTTIAAGGDATAGFAAHKPIGSKKLEAAIKGEKMNLFVFGRVWYEDGFANERFTNFCFKAEKLPPPGEQLPPEMGKTWVMTPFFNDSN